MTDHRQVSVTSDPKTLIGKWVRRKEDGAEFEVMYLGHEQRDGRRCLYGRLLVAMPDDVEPLSPEQEQRAADEWRRNVR